MQQTGEKPCSAKDSGHRGNMHWGCGTGLLGPAGSSSGWLGTLPSRLGDATRADEVAFDDLLAVFVGLETGAVELARCLEVEGALNEGESGKLHTERSLVISTQVFTTIKPILTR